MLHWELLKTGHHPHIEFDSVEWTVEGGRVGYDLWAWRKVKGVMRRVVVGEVVRPVFGLFEEHRAFCIELTGEPPMGIRPTVTLQ